MYFRARYYDPGTGEFISRDPLEFVDGMSLYLGYFWQNARDPFGLCCQTSGYCPIWANVTDVAWEIEYVHGTGKLSQKFSFGGFENTVIRNVIKQLILKLHS